MAKKTTSTPMWARVVAIVLVLGLVMSSLIAIGSQPSQDTTVTVNGFDIDTDAPEESITVTTTEPPLDEGEVQVESETGTISE